MFEFLGVIFGVCFVIGATLTLTCYSYSENTEKRAQSEAVKEIYLCIKYRSIKHGITLGTLARVCPVCWVYKISGWVLLFLFIAMIIGVLIVAIT